MIARSSDYTSFCIGPRHSSLQIDPTLDLCTRYPLRLGGPRQYRIQSLPDTSTHGQHWESNPRPSDLEYNSLSTWPHAPTTMPHFVRIQSLPDTSTHGQHWESNPRPSDLESNALSTWPDVPTTMPCFVSTLLSI